MWRKLVVEGTKLLDAGLCRRVLDSVWDFEDYPKAFHGLDWGQTSGKIIIKVAQ